MHVNDFAIEREKIIQLPESEDNNFFHVTTRASTFVSHRGIMADMKAQYTDKYTKHQDQKQLSV